MHNKPVLALSDEFNEVLTQLEHSRGHFFITGRAGTGKSTLLQVFRKTTRKKTAVLAPTGTAALNVRGQTIHSFFGFPPKLLNPADIRRRKNHRLYANLDTIIIDEISMVRADMLDNIDRFLRINRGDDRPFGGAQMIFFGDLFQLPPVIANLVEKEYLSNHYDSPYFFSAHVMVNSDLQFIELHKVYRQNERRFIRLLDNIRQRFADYDDLEELNSRYVEDAHEEDFFITLTSRNAIVDQINQEKLTAIQAPSTGYPAKIAGTFNPRLFPTESYLELKVGAQVMFVKNDPQKRFVNGSLGKVIELEADKIVVALHQADGENTFLEVEALQWEILKYRYDPNKPKEVESEVIGTFTQYPLKLAWAITIHKSQGKTFDRVIIDLGRGAFEHGQTYVALSRCRTLEGIVLKRPIRPRDILVDERIVDFYNGHR